MDNSFTMFQMINCVNAMKQAINDDAAFNAPGSKKRRDGQASWAAAAYAFSRIMRISEFDINGEQMRDLYIKANSKLNF